MAEEAGPADWQEPVTFDTVNQALTDGAGERVMDLLELGQLAGAIRDLQAEVGIGLYDLSALKQHAKSVLTAFGDQDPERLPPGARELHRATTDATTFLTYT